VLENHHSGRNESLGRNDTRIRVQKVTGFRGAVFGGNFAGDVVVVADIFALREVVDSRSLAQRFYPRMRIF